MRAALSGRLDWCPVHRGATLEDGVTFDRPRVSAAVLRHAGREVLMVKHHRRDGTEYWQLPGGGILPGEDPEAAVLRELREETGLDGRLDRLVFQIPYRLGTSTTYPVQVDPAAEPRLGHDPEEIDADHRKLVAVAWRRLEELPDNPEIRALTAALGPPLEHGRTPA